MRDAASLLVELIDVAERAITRPAINLGEEILKLREQIDDAAPHQADPDGGILLDDEATLLPQVLWLWHRQRALADEDRAALLLQLAGVLLPAVRKALGRAIKVRRDTRATV